jgi:hypothetical protein
MTISTQNEFILVNNETRLDSLNTKLKTICFYLYDTNRYRLYNGVYWFEVTINNAIPKIELKEWLDLI